jgi:hypothetical protein
MKLFKHRETKIVAISLIGGQCVTTIDREFQLTRKLQNFLGLDDFAFYPLLLLVAGILVYFLLWRGGKG